MSTTPEDNPGPENTDKTPEEGGRPTFEPAGSAAPTAEEARPEHGQEEGARSFEGEATAYQGQGFAYEGQGAAYEGQEAAYAHQAPTEPRPGGVLSAETFAVVGLVLLGVTVMSGQLIEMLTSMILVRGQAIAPEQVSHIETQLKMGGAIALLAFLFAGLSLILALTKAGTRPWAKWGATATLIVALLFVIAAAVAYYLMPEAAEPMIPPIFD